MLSSEDWYNGRDIRHVTRGRCRARMEFAVKSFKGFRLNHADSGTLDSQIQILALILYNVQSSLDSGATISGGASRLVDIRSIPRLEQNQEEEV